MDSDEDIYDDPKKDEDENEKKMDTSQTNDENKMDDFVVKKKHLQIQNLKKLFTFSLFFFLIYKLQQMYTIPTITTNTNIEEKNQNQNEGENETIDNQPTVRKKKLNKKINSFF